MLAAIIAIFAVVADQLSKYIVVQNIEYLDKKDFIPNFMSFYHTRNTGGGWSMLDGGGWERVLLILMSLAAMGLVIFILVKFYKRSRLLNISLSMVLGGAIGNMIDRFRLEYVVDFLHAEFMDFPTFNIADCFITVGAALMIIYVIFVDPKIEKRLKAEKEALEAASAGNIPESTDINDNTPSEEAIEESSEEIPSENEGNNG